MARTPEGKVKDAVKKALIAEGVVPFADFASGRAKDAVGFFYMPVAGPFSVHGVHDFVGCWHGVFFSLETKAPDGKEDATPLQRSFYEAVTRTGGVSFVGVRGPEVIDVLKRRVALNRLTTMDQELFDAQV